MSERESHPHFPPVPVRDPRPADLIPTTAPPVDAGGPVAPTPGEEPAAGERVEQERVTLTGRLGQDPTVRTTRNGVLVARFPLGVKDETDLTKTIWHHVLAFRDRAAWVRDTLHRGDAVEVIGYRHEREIPGRNGPRTVEEINATVVKQRS